MHVFMCVVELKLDGHVMACGHRKIWNQLDVKVEGVYFYKYLTSLGSAKGTPGVSLKSPPARSHQSYARACCNGSHISYWVNRELSSHLQVRRRTLFLQAKALRAMSDFPVINQIREAFPASSS